MGHPSATAAAGRPSERRGRSRSLLGATVLALALGACSGSAAAPADGPAVDAAPSTPVDEPAASPATVPSTPDTGEAALVEAPTAMPATTLVPAEGVLPRSLAYGMLTWTVVHAAITAEDPRTYTAGVTGPPTARTSLVLDLTIRNDNTLVTVITSQARFTVTLADGTVVPGTDLGRTAIPPVSQADGRYAFEVPAGTGFDGLVVGIGDPGREPSFELPLQGPPPEIETVATFDGDVEMDVPLPGIDMAWTIDQVLVGRDWPLPVGHKGGTLPSGARAPAGHRWLGIVARVDVGRCACKGGVLDQAGSARLFLDDLPYTAVAAHSSKAILNASTFSDVMLVFDLPTPATEPILQVGPLDDRDQQARARLDID